ncbi:MAG: hypothetical protein KIS91_14085 [Anaerolineae bacterium]|nr:hypothetical protein [Anaerolineae bacterium]
MPTLNWTEYLRDRAALRGFDLALLENIVQYSTERYFDTETGRHVVVVRHDDQLILIPFELEGDQITPVTVHAITRQQIRFRLSTEGR